MSNIPPIEDVGSLIYAPLPEQPPFLFPGLIPQWGAVAIVAETNLGKSLLALEIGASAVTGEPLWGAIEPTKTAKKVVYFLAEHSEYTLQDLYHKTRLPHSGQFWIVGPDKMKPSKALVRGGQADQEAVDRLTKWSEGADLVVFDPLSAYVQGANAEQDNAVMRLVLDQMQLIAQTNNAACLILAHEGKPQSFMGHETKRKTYKIRGASSIEDALTHVFYFDKGQTANSYVLDLERKFKGTPLVGQIHLSRDAETLQHRMLNAPPLTAKQNRLIKFKTEIAALSREYPDLSITKKVPMAATRAGVGKTAGWEYWKQIGHSDSPGNTYIEAPGVPELE